MLVLDRLDLLRIDEQAFDTVVPLFWQHQRHSLRSSVDCAAGRGVQGWHRRRAFCASANAGPDATRRRRRAHCGTPQAASAAAEICRSCRSSPTLTRPWWAPSAPWCARSGRSSRSSTCATWQAPWPSPARRCAERGGPGQVHTTSAWAVSQRIRSSSMIVPSTKSHPGTSVRCATFLLEPVDRLSGSVTESRGRAGGRPGESR